MSGRMCNASQSVVVVLPSASERAMSSDTKVWRVRAQEFRRMAKTSAEAERERKLLALAAKAEEQAETVEQEAERSQD